MVLATVRHNWSLTLSIALWTPGTSIGSERSSNSEIVMTAGAISLAPGSIRRKNTSAQASDRFELLATYSLLIFHLLQMPETRQSGELLAAHANVLGPRRITNESSADAGPHARGREAAFDRSPWTPLRRPQSPPPKAEGGYRQRARRSADPTMPHQPLSRCSLHSHPIMDLRICGPLSFSSAAA